MPLIVPEFQAQQTAMCKLLRKRVRSFYANEQNRREFELWYEKQYGKPYVWKRVTA